MCLREELAALGAEVIEIPTIEIRPPDSWEPLDAAIRRLEEFHYLLVTSANGVRNFLARLAASGRDVRALKGLTIGAIGPATAAEFARTGVKVDLLPTEYVAEGLVAALGDRDLRGKAFLIPRARVARDLVPRVLEERGARVEVVEAYQTVMPEISPDELARLLTPPPDAITFTSSSTATNFAKLVGEDRLAETLRGVGHCLHRPHHLRKLSASSALTSLLKRENPPWRGWCRHSEVTSVRITKYRGRLSYKFSSSRSFRVWARLTGISVCLRSCILSW